MFKRRKLDSTVTSMIAAVDRDDRVVAWATVAGDRYVVASVRGLWWPVAGDDPAAMRRIPWERVDKAVWRDGVLIVVEADLVDDLVLVDRSPAALPLVEPGDVPRQVKRRVDASVVRSEIVPVVGGQARIVARRIPGRDGLTWWARLEGTTPDNVMVRYQLENAIARFTAEEAAKLPQI
ncbi:hypothetical protein ACXR2U_17505 [Jatrophihabitans sp. YIM 134969]